MSEAFFYWYQFRDLGYSLTHLPENNCLIIQSSLALYYVSDDDNTQLWKYTFATNSDAQLDVDPGDAWGGDDKSRPNGIKGAWHDRDNSIIYFFDDDTGQDTHIFSVDLSDDSVIEEFSRSATGYDALMIGDDIWLYHVAGHDLPIHLYTQFYRLGDANEFSQDMGALGVRSPELGITPLVVIGTIGYFLWHWSDENVELWKVDFVGETVVEIKDCGANTDFPNSISQRAITYDGSDLLFFILEDTTDSKNYLYSYSISNDTLTKGGEYNACLMADRNCSGESHLEYEKAFSITGSYVYQTSRGRAYLSRIQNLLLTGGSTIIAITDEFLIDSDKNVYQFNDVSDNIINARIEEELYQISEGWIKVKGDASSYTPGNEVWFYDRNDVLSWVGIILTPEYNIKGSASSDYVSKVKLIGISSAFDAVYRKNFTTARDSDYILKYIIDNFLTRYHSYDDEIDDFAITYKYDLKKPILKMLYYLAMLERGVIHALPGGEVFFNAHDNLMSMYDGYYQGSAGFNYETVGETAPDWLTDDISVGDSGFEIIAELDDHKNVLKCIIDNGDTCRGYHSYTSQTNPIHEFYFGTSDITKNSTVYFTASGGTLGNDNIAVAIYFNTSKIRCLHGDGIGGNAWTDLEAAPVNDTLYHIKVELDCATDTVSVWLNGTLKVDGEEFYKDNTFESLNCFVFYAIDAGTYNVYVDAIALVGETDPNGYTYVEGDNLGFRIFEHTIAEHFAITKYVPAANRYITRAPVIGAYNSDGQVYVVGVAATQAADEDQFGIRQLQAWRDPEITNYTEADQLATNLQIIYSEDTQFIHILSQGYGHIQVGYTLKVRSTSKFIITAEEFLCLRRIWHPTTDLCEFVLSDNILSEAMFNRRVSQKLYDIEAQQSYEDPDASEMIADGTVMPLYPLSKLRALSPIIEIKAVAPTVNEDIGDGYNNGTFWLNTVTHKLYVLEDNTSGAASWVILN